jgi:hypothetical protein
VYAYLQEPVRDGMPTDSGACACVGVQCGVKNCYTLLTHYSLHTTHYTLHYSLHTTLHYTLHYSLRTTHYTTHYILHYAAHHTIHFPDRLHSDPSLHSAVSALSSASLNAVATATMLGGQCSVMWFSVV